MHSERVSRHINGVEQSMVELRHGLETLNDNLNDRLDRFEDDVKALETQFSAATKTSRFVL